MKDVNACEELIFKYSEALILSAFERVKKTSAYKFEDQGYLCFCYDKSRI